MLRTLGQWLRKLRIMTHEVRTQTGIDELLRAEGLQGGLTELRSLIRGQAPAFTPPYTPPPPPPPPAPREPAVVEDDPYANVEVDPTREYPPEGPDAYGALPDDLLAALEEPATVAPSLTADGQNAEPTTPRADSQNEAAAAPEASNGEATAANVDGRDAEKSAPKAGGGQSAEGTASATGSTHEGTERPPASPEWSEPGARAS